MINFDLNFSNPSIVNKINCYYFQKIPSTNDQVWELHKQGHKFPLVAIASEQTAGKGQRGHKWESSRGGLYLSLGLESDLPLNCAHHITLFSSWGIAHTLRKYQIDVKIKWLNDLILEQKKLAGILSETRIYQNRIKQIVIGVGINWRNLVPPRGINLQSVLDKQLNPKLNSLEELIELTIRGILQGYKYYFDQGIESLLPEYENLLVNRGQKITLEGLEGIVTGISPQGELKLRLSSPGATTEICLSPHSFSLGYD
jgi:BirA family biotin operon repressor/biotin-[acetyl-CoA-carboxylase] ligase